MSAWNGTEAFNEALQVPCGCDLLHKAEEAFDKSERELLLSEAPDFQKQWNCPFSKDHDPKREPTKKCKESYVPLSRLTKIPLETIQAEVKTCPRACTSQPWISESIEFYNWREKGQLQMLFGNGEMPNVVKEAIDAIELGVKNYERYLARVAKEKQENNNSLPHGKMKI